MDDSRPSVGGDTEVRVHFAALLVACTRAGLFDATADLWDWAEEHLDMDRDELEEELDLDA